MNEQNTNEQQEIIQNLVNKVALKEYQLSQYEVLVDRLEKQLKELGNEKEGE